MQNYYVNVQFLLACILNLRAISRYESLGACICGAIKRKVFLRYEFGGAYFTEFYDTIVSTNFMFVSFS